MPNGGSDNCGTCGFNRANKGKWKPYNTMPTDEAGFCMIRNISISNPWWTYCVNYHTRSNIPEGPMFAAGLLEYKGHLECRIPWNDENEPRTGVAGQCSICGRSFDLGVEVNSTPSTVQQFCCNAHYVRWWKDRHPGLRLAWEYGWDEPI